MLGRNYKCVTSSYNGVKSLSLRYSVTERNLKHDIGHQTQMGLYIPKRKFCASQKVKLNAVMIEFHEI